MRLLAAMDDMAKVLVSADAPERQLKGVREWRADIAYALAAGSGFASVGKLIDTNRGPTLTRGWARPEGVLFLFGTPTHRAWRNLCKMIVRALEMQQWGAELVRESALDIVAAVELRAKRGIATPADISRAEAAAVKAQLAEEWWCAASYAAAAGRSLIKREDRIMRPIGLAIAAAGGLDQVVRDKHYHTAGRL